MRPAVRSERPTALFSVPHVAGSGTRAGRSVPAVPRDFLRPCVLLLVGERRGHGYELLARLRTLGLPMSARNGRYAGGGNVYRMLRRLETAGLVCAAREPSRQGADRRTYELTTAGREELGRRAKALAEASDKVEAFMRLYEQGTPGVERPAGRGGQVPRPFRQGRSSVAASA